MKNVMNKVKEYVNRIINSELFIIIIGLILFVKVTIFYKLTIYIGCPIDKGLIAKTFIFSMMIVVGLFLFGNRIRFVLGMLVNLIFSIIMFADNLYYNYSTSLISVAQVSNLQYSDEISTALKDLLSVMQISYFIDILFIIILLICKYLKIEKNKPRKWKAAITYISIVIIVYGSTVPSYVQAAEQYKYNKKMQIELGTIYGFHYLDVKSVMNMKKDIKYKNKEDVIGAYTRLKESYEENYGEDIYNLKGIAKNKNVIVIQLESFQNYLVNKKINGKEITPNLNKFLRENIYFDNMMTQSYTTTADSEHSAMTSMYPLDNGMAFAQYSGNKYDDYFGIYNENGYYTVYMHGNDGAFWNRNNVYGNLKIDELDFIESFRNDDTYYINDWVSDESLYKQGFSKISEIKQPFFANIVSASSHNAFDLPGLNNKYDYVDIDVGTYKGMYFGDYLESINYADKQFGMFIEKMKQSGLYDDTMILVYGDHYGVQMRNYEMLDFIEENDHKLNNTEIETNYINVPCGIHIPGIEHKRISKTVSKLDIKPTLCYLSGIDDGFSIGTNMFEKKDFVCLNNGIVVTDKYYYNGAWYHKESGEKIDIESSNDALKDELKYYIDCMEEELAISNSIVVKNLLY